MYVEHVDTIANTGVSVTLPVESYSILVKNFSDGDIRITLNDKYNQNNYILIPSQCSQELTINKRNELEYKFGKVGIYSESSNPNGVEVQCIKF